MHQIQQAAESENIKSSQDTAASKGTHFAIPPASPWRTLDAWLAWPSPIGSGRQVAHPRKSSTKCMYAAQGTE